MRIITGDALESLRDIPDGSVNCCITSPPYWGLRDYGCAGQLGLEETLDEYIANLGDVFEEVRRVLREDGTLWLIIGDTYCGTPSKGSYQDPLFKGKRNGQSKSVSHKVDGFKRKDLLGVPWRVAFALQEVGWYLRQDIIWQKPNAMPESVKDRCSKAHEYVFLLSKSEFYYYDYAAIMEPCLSGDKNSPRGSKGAFGPQQAGRREYVVKERTANSVCLVPGRNKRSVWTVPFENKTREHVAVFPERLIEPCILAGCPPEGIVLDPFLGSGTTAIVAAAHGRDCIGIEINPEYVQLAKDRLGLLAHEEEAI